MKLTREPLLEVSYYFQRINVLVEIADQSLYHNRVSLLVPKDIIEQTSSKEQAVANLLNANGITCKLLQQPKRSIVQSPKD
ncbi:MAG: hypothetical protein AAFV95_22455 [Bacteroidota bacterium]